MNYLTQRHTSPLPESIRYLLRAAVVISALWTSRESMASDDALPPLLPVTSSSATSPGEASRASTSSSSTQDGALTLAANEPTGIASVLSTTSVAGVETNTATAAPVTAGDAGGPFPVTFNLNFLTLYESNINIRHTNIVGDLEWDISPGIDYATGDLAQQPENYFHASYSPTISKFLDNPQNDFLGQDAAINYQYTGERLVAGANATYVRSDYPNVDAGGRLSADNYNFGLFANYHVDNRLNFLTDFNQAFDRYEQGIDTDEWYTDAALDYALAPKTTVGLGLRLGYLDILDNSRNQYYEQLRARAAYLVTQKITLSAYVGGEERQYEGDGSSLNPVAGLTGTYNATAETTLTGNVSYASVPSIILNRQNYQDAHVDLSLNQVLPHNFYCLLSVSYDNNSYYATQGNTGNAGLVNNYFTIHPEVGWKWTKYFSMAAYYSCFQNISSRDTNSFQDNSVGLQLHLTY